MIIETKSLKIGNSSLALVWNILFWPIDSANITIIGHEKDRFQIEEDNSETQFPFIKISKFAIPKLFAIYHTCLQYNQNGTNGWCFSRILFPSVFALLHLSRAVAIRSVWIPISIEDLGIAVQMASHYKYNSTE